MNCNGVTNLAWSLFTFDEFHIKLDALLDGTHHRGGARVHTSLGSEVTVESGGLQDHNTVIVVADLERPGRHGRTAPPVTRRGDGLRAGQFAVELQGRLFCKSFRCKRASELRGFLDGIQP
jgi:hypothetical protein